MAQNDKKWTFPAKDVLMDESKCNVVFIVDGNRIPALKELLSFKSYVFAAMFSASFKESNEKEIHVKDLNAEAYKTMIHFLHCEELNFKGQEDFPTVIELLKCGDKYQLPQLMSAIGEYLIPLITLDKLEVLYGLSASYKLENLKTILNDFIDKQLDQILDRNNMAEFGNINTLSNNYLLESIVKRQKQFKRFITSPINEYSYYSSNYTLNPLSLIINGYTYTRCPEISGKYQYTMEK